MALRSEGTHQMLHDTRELKRQGTGWLEAANRQEGGLGNPETLELGCAGYSWLWEDPTPGRMLERGWRLSTEGLRWLYWHTGRVDVPASSWAGSAGASQRFRDAGA